MTPQLSPALAPSSTSSILPSPPRLLHILLGQTQFRWPNEVPLVGLISSRLQRQGTVQPAGYAIRCEFFPNFLIESFPLITVFFFVFRGSKSLSLSPSLINLTTVFSSPLDGHIERASITRICTVMEREREYGKERNTPSVTEEEDDPGDWNCP